METDSIIIENRRLTYKLSKEELEACSEAGIEPEMYLGSKNISIQRVGDVLEVSVLDCLTSGFQRFFSRLGKEEANKCMKALEELGLGKDF